MEVQESLRILYSLSKTQEPGVSTVRKGRLQVWFHSNVWKSAPCWQEMPGRGCNFYHETKEASVKVKRSNLI